MGKSGLHSSALRSVGHRLAILMLGFRLVVEAVTQSDLVSRSLQMRFKLTIAGVAVAILTATPRQMVTFMIDQSILLRSKKRWSNW